MFHVSEIHVHFVQVAYKSRDSWFRIRVKQAGELSTLRYDVASSWAIFISRVQLGDRKAGEGSERPHTFSLGFGVKTTPTSLHLPTTRVA